jgi:type IV pilus assembly protein PilA
MIVIAIIGILSMIGVPQYVVYSKRAKFVDIVTASNQLRKAVELCMLTENNSTNCSSGDSLGVDTAHYESGDNISLVQISEFSPGTVAITVTASDELNNTNYMLRGTYIPTTSEVNWLLDPASTCLLPNYRYCFGL